MKEILILLIIYLGYLLLWFTINLLAYFVSLIFKKKRITVWLAGISVFASFLLNFLLGGVLLIWAISVLFSGQILLFILLLLFGISLVTMLFTYLQMPFMAISVYFQEKIESFDFGENVVEAEILDKDNRVIGKIEGETTISTRMAKWFLAFYGLNLIDVIVGGGELGWGDYVLNPFLKIIGGTIIIGLPYGIYRKLRGKPFFTKDKRYFYINTWKVNVFTYGVIIAIIVLLLFFLGD